VKYLLNFVFALAVTSAAPALARDRPPELTAAQLQALQFGADRTEIENLQARYMFALDWQDAAAYASTFTEDGVLDWAGGVSKGRDAIFKEVQGMRATFARREAADAPKRPARLRHFITNVVVKIDGDHATGRAYWFEIDDNTSTRAPIVSGYGHYDDDLRKVDGHWLFSRRRINNEVMDSRAAGMTNPAW
jgi:hypothetical protein